MFKNFIRGILRYFRTLVISSNLYKITPSEIKDTSGRDIEMARVIYRPGIFDDCSGCDKCRSSLYSSHITIDDLAQKGFYNTEDEERSDDDDDEEDDITYVYQNVGYMSPGDFLPESYSSDSLNSSSSETEEDGGMTGMMCGCEKEKCNCVVVLRSSIEWYPGSKDGSYIELSNI